MPDADPDDMLAPAEALASMLRGDTSEDEDAWRVAAIAKLIGIEIVVKRQGDIDRTIKAAVSKAKGAAILISLDGWEDGPGDAGRPKLPLVHSISLWTTPIMRPGAIAESIALGALVRAVHAWTPDASPARKMYRWRIGAGRSGSAADDVTKQPVANIYEFPATFEIDLLHV